MTQRSPEREAMFEFGRRLAEPGFRKVLAAHGYIGGSAQDVVVTHDDAKVGEVLDRVFTRCRPPALVAIRRPSAEYGFALALVEPSADAATARGSGRQVDRLSEDTSIGMLYDSIRHTHGTTFEMGEHRSYAVQRIDGGRALADA